MRLSFQNVPYPLISIPKSTYSIHLIFQNSPNPLYPLPTIKDLLFLQIIILNELSICKCSFIWMCFQSQIRTCHFNTQPDNLCLL